MIVITGAAGFIGSCWVSKLNNEGYYDLILVDDFSNSEKNKNFEQKKYKLLVDRSDFISWLKENQLKVQFVFHIGARTDTVEQNVDLFNKLNFHYSQEVWNVCSEYGIPLVYASSAATYGLGELGYEDDHAIIPKLKPLNPYGDSKNNFDNWVLLQEKKPSFWAGLKFFNVYGPNEYHKGRMASVIFHAYKSVLNTGEMKLFRSHNPEFKDGEQKRDFIYVKDVVNVFSFLMHHRKNSGIYNLGSGKARTFLDLVNALFKEMNREPRISFVDTPEDIRKTYQYFTEAKMDKLINIGYKESFYSLEDGISDYVKNYLITNQYY